MKFSLSKFHFLCFVSMTFYTRSTFRHGRLLFCQRIYEPLLFFCQCIYEPLSLNKQLFVSIFRGVLFIVRAGNDIIKADFVHTKRITLNTEMKIGIHLEELK